MNAPETGTMSAGGSVHRSTVFNTPSMSASASPAKNAQGKDGIKAELERQMKDLEAKKEAAQKAMVEAQAAAAASKAGGAKDTSVVA